MATDFKNELLKTFLENDKKVTLVNEKDDFQVELSLTAAKLFSTHMKEKIEETENDESISFDVSEYTRENVEIFVKYLHGNIVITSTLPSDDEIESFTSWEIIVPLIKLSFHFKLRELDKNHLLSVCKQSITKDNVFEAIALMDVYSFDNWKEQCCSVLQEDITLLENEKCLQTMKEHSQVASIVFCSLAKLVFETAKKEAISFRERSIEYCKTEGTIELKVPNITKVTADKTICSDPVFIRNLSWQLCLRKQRNDTGEEGAFVYVECNPNVEDITWSCQAHVTLTFKKKFSNGFGLNHTYNKEFNKDECASGYSLVTWEELIDQSKGFIKDDDSIHIEAYVKARMPNVEREL